MRKITHLFLLLINLLWAVSYAALQPGEGMVLDPVTGDYVFSFRGGLPGNPLTQKIFIPSTKIEPIVSSSLKLIDNWHVRYGYTLTNGTNAKQSIVRLRIFGLPANAHITGTTTTITEGNNRMDLFEPTMAVPNSDWYGSGARVPKERAPPNGVTNIGWNYDYDSEPPPDPLLGILPGTALGGFSFISRDLPGLLAARVQGGGSGHLGFSSVSEGAPSEEMEDQYEQLLKTDFVPRNAAVPTIPVPSPFNAAVTLERIREHARTWVAKQLLDAAFLAQMESYFQAAIDAYRAGQPLVGKKQLEALRELIKKEQPYAEKNELAANSGDGRTTTLPAKIDLLAARILFFDLIYVTERGS